MYVWFYDGARGVANNSFSSSPVYPFVFAPFSSQNLSDKFMPNEPSSPPYLALHVPALAHSHVCPPPVVFLLTSATPYRRRPQAGRAGNGLMVQHGQQRLGHPRDGAAGASAGDQVGHERLPLGETFSRCLLKLEKVR